MPSAIDPTRPATGAPVSKAGERANWAAARAELEHGGFFTQLGTGAIERMVRDKLREVISVKDFGAVGDGTADDTAALQAADDAAAAARFPIVGLPPGTYRLNSTVNKNPRTIWVMPRTRSNFGSGHLATVIWSYVDGPAVRVTGFDNNDTRGGIIGGTWRTTDLTNLPGSIAIELVDTYDQFIEGVYAFFFNKGIYARRSGGLLSNHLLFFKHLYTSRNNISIHLNDVDDVWILEGDYAGYNYGILAEACTSLSFIGGRHEFSGKANVRLDGCHNIAFNACRIDLSYNRPAIATVHPTWATVFGETTDNPNRQFGVELVDCQRAMFSNSDIFRIGATNSAVNKRVDGTTDVEGVAIGLEARDGASCRSITVTGGIMWRGTSPQATMYGIRFEKNTSGTVEQVGISGVDMASLAAAFLQPDEISKGLKVDRNSCAGLDKAATRTIAAQSLRFGHDAPVQYFDGPVASHINIDIYTTGWAQGESFTIIRNGTGAGVINLRRNGSGSISNLDGSLFAGLTGAGQYAVVMVFDVSGSPVLKVVETNSPTVAYLPANASTTTDYGSGQLMRSSKPVQKEHRERTNIGDSNWPETEAAANQGCEDQRLKDRC